MPQPEKSPWDNEQSYYEPEPEGRGGCFWASLFLGAVVALVLVLVASFPDATGGDVDWARLTYLGVLLAFVVVCFAGAVAANITKAIRHLAIWIGIAAGIALLFSFRHEFGFIKDRVVANVVPTQGMEERKGRSVTFYASQDGHYYIEADVEGESILFMVDTGASNVVLTHRDAEKLRLDPAVLDYSQMVQTANGTVRAAPITLEGIGIGAIYVRNVRASVNEAEMGISLLGMSFLRELEGFEFADDRMTLRQ